MSSAFETGQSTNSIAWKVAKWENFVLVLTNTQMLKKSSFILNSSALISLVYRRLSWEPGVAGTKITQSDATKNRLE